MHRQVSSREIEEFENKASEVHATIQGLLSGTISPFDIDVDLSDKNPIDDNKRKVLYEERKAQEYQQWWEIAKNRNIDSTSQVDSHSSQPRHVSGDKSVLLKSSYEYYSKWDQWTPSDPVTLAEEEEKRQKERDEFEKSNPDFCQQFLQDIDKRHVKEKEARKKSEEYRLNGNKLFQQEGGKKYQEAIHQFMEGLKCTPFDVKLTFNIAQAYIRLTQYEDAMEFLSRTLFLEPSHIKALSRKAHVQSVLHQYSDAIETVDLALSYPSQSSTEINSNSDNIANVDSTAAINGSAASTSNNNTTTTTTTSIQKKELLAQKQEYQQLLIEFKKEEQLKVSLVNQTSNIVNNVASEVTAENNAMINTTQITINNSGSVLQTDIQLIDDLFDKHLTSVLSSFSTHKDTSKHVGSNNIDNDNGKSVTENNLIIELEQYLSSQLPSIQVSLTACQEKLRNSSNNNNNSNTSALRIYIRTSQKIQNILLPLVTQVHRNILSLLHLYSVANGTKESNNVASSPLLLLLLLQLIVDLYAFLSSCIWDEYSSQKVLYQYCSLPSPLSTSSSSSSSSFLKEMFELFHCLATDSSFTTSDYSNNTNTNSNNNNNTDQLQSVKHNVIATITKLFIICTQGSTTLTSTEITTPINNNNNNNNNNQQHSSSSSCTYTPLSEYLCTHHQLSVALELSQYVYDEILMLVSADNNQIKSSNNYNNIIDLFLSNIRILDHMFNSSIGIIKLKEYITTGINNSNSHSNISTTIIPLLARVLYSSGLIGTITTTNNNIKNIDFYMSKILGMFLSLSQWEEVCKSKNPTLNTSYFTSPTVPVVTTKDSTATAAENITPVATQTFSDINNNVLNNKPVVVSAISILIDCLRTHPQHIVNCLAILMNIASINISSSNDNSNSSSSDTDSRDSRAAVVTLDIRNHIVDNGLLEPMLTSLARMIEKYNKNNNSNNNDSNNNNNNCSNINNKNSSGSSNTNNNMANVDTQARYMGLLSRLVSVSTVSERLKLEFNYILLCRRLQQCVETINCFNNNSTINHNNNYENNNSPIASSGTETPTEQQEQQQQNIQWIKEERNYIITILASLSSSSITTTTSNRNTIKSNTTTSNTPLSFSTMSSAVTQYSLMDSLMSVFPTPRTELNQVTPTSVILYPLKSIESSLLLGNAACCLLNYADKPEFIQYIFLRKGSDGHNNNNNNNNNNTSTNTTIRSSSLSSDVITSDTILYVDKMICAIATCTDVRVRKNISILLAKGCRDSQAKERVTLLRGMEMIRALNS